MKRLYFIFIIFPLFFCYSESDAQVYFYSDFDQNPWMEWEHTQDWRIDASSVLDGRNSLQHNVFHRNGISFLSHKIDGLDLNSQDIVWEFMFKTSIWQLDENERLGVYLCADNTSLVSASGMAIGVNLFSQSGKWEVCRMENGLAVESLFQFPKSINNSEPIVFRVERSNEGAWVLQYKNAGANSWEKSARFIAESYPFASTEYFGPFFQHSTNHGGQLWFDDFLVTAEYQNPTISYIQLSSPNSLTIQFSQAMELSSVTNSHNYSITDLDFHVFEIYSIESLDAESTLFSVSMAQSMSDSLILTLSSVTGQLGLPLLNSEHRFAYRLEPQKYHLLLSEIMFDPKTTTLYDGEEYIEVYNPQSYPVDVGHTKLTINSKDYSLPEKQIKAHAYAVVVDETWFAQHQKTDVEQTTFLPISSFQLPNKGAFISLSTRGDINDSLTYHQAMIDSSCISMERVDLNRMCDQEHNWISSNSVDGGTPGIENSVAAENQDVVLPFVEHLIFHSPTEVDLIFNEEVSLHSNVSFPTENPGTVTGLNSHSFRVHWDHPLSFGEGFTLRLDSVEDLCGNIASIEVPIFNRIPTIGSVLFSEIMFNPKEESPEFIEIVNRSDFDVDLQYLCLEVKGKTSVKSYPLATDQFKIFPQECVVITSDVVGLEQTYPIEHPECIVLVERFPALPNDGATLYLRTRDSMLLDSVTYSDSMYSRHFHSSKGISMQRTNVFDLTHAKQWTFTPESCGFATPTSGTCNAIDEHDADWFHIENEIVSPNGDGFNDELSLTIHPQSGDWISTIEIYNINGLVVRTLQSQVAMGAYQQVKWNGQGDQNQTLPLGNYIVVIDLVSEDGAVLKARHSFALTDRLP